LEKFQKHEKRLQEKLDSIDAGAKNLFENSKEEYNKLSGIIKSKTSKAIGGSEPYNSYLDTLSTSLSFLKQFKNAGNVTKPMASLSNLQSKLQQSEKVKEFVSQRKQQIKELLSKYTKIPIGLKKEYARLNKTAYYYSAQVNEYKQMLKDPAKAERKALSFLNKLPAFQKFMQKNSQLASLFRMPDNYGTPQSLAGLQTRASVEGLIQQRISAGGPNGQQMIQQNIAQAHSEMNKLKDKINKLGGGNSDAEMPDFKPNNQKAKSFLKRLEFGANVQSQKTNNFLPVTSDVALSAGYKLNDKSIIGIGASYKLGWGSGWRHIRLSNEGFGVRSYLDIKLKGSLWISGGYEKNYQSAFTKIDQLKNLSAWQTSGLIGMTKKLKIGRNTKNLQLLWDFLSYRQVPRRQPVLFRIGYVF
ncbi:MAG: hypothetical protein ABIO55_05285, partial [Ginsengibacter sp.]